jgi:hypothetical protein
MPRRVKLRRGGQDSAWKKVATAKRVKHRINPLVRFELLNFDGANALNKPCVIRQDGDQLSGLPMIGTAAISRFV